MPKPKQSLEALIQEFLRGAPFLLISCHIYHKLGVGKVRLPEQMLVCNGKIQGEFRLGGSSLYFRVVRQVPSKVTPNFLLADLAGNLDWLAEDPLQMKAAIFARMQLMHRSALTRAFDRYGNISARKLFQAFKTMPIVPI